MAGGDITRQTHNPGDRIFREGDPGDCVYLIEEGLVELSKGVECDAVVIGNLKKGDILGEMALIDGAPRSATARVVQPTKTVAFSSIFFQQKLDTMDPVMKKLFLRYVAMIRGFTKSHVDRSTVIR